MLDVACEVEPTLEYGDDSGRPAAAPEEPSCCEVATPKRAVFLLQNGATIGPASARKNPSVNDVATEKRARCPLFQNRWLALGSFARIDDVEPTGRGTVRRQNHDRRFATSAAPDHDCDPEQGALHTDIVAGDRSKNETAAYEAAVQFTGAVHQCGSTVQ